MTAPWSRSKLSWLLMTTIAMVDASKHKYIMYLTGQHNVVPRPELVADVTHVTLAFMRSDFFNDAGRTEWPLFTTIEEVRPKFAVGTAIQVAIGGWGDTDGFSRAAKTNESRELFARNVKAMLDVTGAEGVDIDWEYPGGNGEDYKQHLNGEKAWEIEAYPKLLAEIRTAIGPSHIISAAVPGLPRDMLAFTHGTIPLIAQSVDFFNIMAYDLMNRRDNVTKHHTGLDLSQRAINAYLERGVPFEKANLGLAFYVKWFKTAADADCHISPIGCRTDLMEDPSTGADLGKAGAFSWHDAIPLELSESFKRAIAEGKYEDGGYYYWDEKERLFWSWDTPTAIQYKLHALVEKSALGGVFAWGLGEDAPKFQHLRAANEVMRGLVSSTSEHVYEERSEL
ncbi:glycoside hydrolase family 18 protein [Cucurbitaria berberidis CBS 394.84]|uniref:chitinase n=1 Tax=Cucurbitaria berberidis CBS 394.84 TaxID=1168544 RepID=A0A9P4GSC8_9PLEO|nr:glycoside hydrolase family 18 protein [Cucurbitaria berberidis CBS 394.84]KAF1850922.1 glycoside hydrolase family 18 protein [Cucurbitaria berberidis CBS 394.84]